jgi:hypothetical protein
VKTLLILGNDATASWLGNRLQSEKVDRVNIYLDATNSIKRVTSLLLNRRIRVSTLIRLFYANLLRQSMPFDYDGQLASNKELVDVINDVKPDQVLCFRCGLIINQLVLETGVPIYNIHVSSLPEFSGLGTIAQSIIAEAWNQYACLHKIDEGIDTGEVMVKKGYSLNSNLSYKKNEDIAYMAGVHLAIEFLNSEHGKYST